MRGKLGQVYDKLHAQRFVMQLLIIALAVALDQVSKHLVTSMLAQNETLPLINGMLSLTYIHNTGASFGMLQGARIFFLIATALTLIVLGVYMVKARKKQSKWLRTCLSLIAAGAIGNFIDRILFGYVRDFVDIRGLYFPWIFNVADMCLVVGSIMLGIFILFIHKEKDGRTIFARRGRKEELLGEDEKLDSAEAPEVEEKTATEEDSREKGVLDTNHEAAGESQSEKHEKYD